ncbi:murein biosynthesis integral membrane protein MurJ [Gordonia jinhuaensis]|uniref:Murein biosynthesis integral membrane protein MurJ n=1 Tax=Gordonia jinhuaensis TaxID=1517702 RepID=A0A916T495_9ACTN|nr:murein biosynthesis integral membrane protein MurJ [Gordonia jinhuaensis]
MRHELDSAFGEDGTSVGAQVAQTPIREPLRARTATARRGPDGVDPYDTDADDTDPDDLTDDDAGESGVQRPARDSDASVLRTSGSIAIATLTSRITGFVRAILVAALLGPAIASAFLTSYTLPSMVAEALLGAVLTAIVIPVLVRAEAEDADGGAGFINRVFTLALTVLGVGTVVALIAAPLLTYVSLGDGKVDRTLATALAYLLLPEILFYGLSALFIAILNMKGLFKPGAWAPVMNNIVQILALVAYAVTPGEITLNPVRMSDPKLLVLGIGTTLGVIVQTAVLLPALRRAKVRLKLQWGLDARLRQFGQMAAAVILYVLVLQVGWVITTHIAASVSAAGPTAYNQHWQLLQLPYGVLGVTILTAMMPRLSRNAAAGDTNRVIDDMSMATRLTLVALVPVTAYMTFFGPAIGLTVFHFGRFDADTATQVGSVLAWGAFTIIPYAMTLVQLRVFYAREDAWTPTFMVIGITAVKTASSLLGTVLFSDPDLVVRWLALSNGLGYLVGAIVGHYLLRRRLGNVEMTNVKRTTLVTLAASVVVSLVVWLIAEASGLAGLARNGGKLGSLGYLILTAIIVLGATYALLVAFRVPDVVAIGVALRRALSRFIPALAPKTTLEPDDAPAMTVQFPRISSEESLPYSGQVQVLRRFDQGTASWQSYAVHTGGAAGQRGTAGSSAAAWSASDAGHGLRYRRRGVGPLDTGEVDDKRQTGARPDSGVNTPDNAVGTPVTGAPTAGSSTAGDPAAGGSTAGQRSRPDTPRQPAVDGDSGAAPTPPRRRGPRLVPGAQVAGGRYRLLSHHGGTRGLQFWRARDIHLDRDVALTFVDPDQSATPATGTPPERQSEGPQAVLSRTLRLGRVNTPGIARVLDVVRGYSGGIVVSEWVSGSSLAEVAATHPSPIGAARAVRALGAAAESAHRTGTALSIDHPDRIRISTDGNAVLAFPGTLAGDDKATDVKGLGAVLYALLLERWPLDDDNPDQVATTATHPDPIGGLQAAEPDDNGFPVEPRMARGDIPFEISAVAARALQGNSGIRTAATVQHVLDQATVVDQPTDLMPAVPGPAMRPEPATNVGRTRRLRSLLKRPESMRTTALLVGAGLLILFLIVAIVVSITNALGGSGGSDNIDSILTPTTSASAAAPKPTTSASAPAPAAGPVTFNAVTLVDFSNQPPDSSANLRNTITGAPPAWKTDTYQGGPRFGNLKNGLGLMYRLESPAAVRTVTIRTTTPGFSVEVRPAPSANATLSQTSPVATAQINRPTTTITVSDPRSAPYLLVWITSLASTSGGYSATVNQVGAAS